jgi:hypothetical protein
MSSTWHPGGTVIAADFIIVIEVKVIEYWIVEKSIGVEIIHWLIAN